MALAEARAIQADLTLPEAEMRAWGEQALDMVIEHFLNLPHKPVVTLPEKQALQKALREPIPQTPQDRETTLALLRDVVFRHMGHNDHPRFFPFVPGPSNFIGVIAELLGVGFNTFSGTWLEASGPTEVELVTLEWLRELFGLPPTAAGIFVTGGSTANWTAMASAREYYLKGLDDERRVQTFNRMTVYYSDQTHHSVERGLRLLGFVQRQLREIPSDSHFALDMDALRAQIARDKAEGWLPAILVANIGTTNTGIFDPLDALLELRDAEKLWLHADAAYGGAVILSPRYQTLLAGLGQVDSLTIDPHKWLFQPFEIGCILIRDGAHMSQTFQHVAEYIEDIDPKQEDEVNLQNYGYQQTRNFRALKLWLSLKAFGLEAFRQAVEHGIHLAEHAETLIRNRGSKYEIALPAQIGIFNFRYVVAGKTDADLDKLNKAIVDKMLDDRFAMIHTTVLTGKKYLRLCIINPRTSYEDVEETLRRIERFGDEMVAAWGWS